MADPRNASGGKLVAPKVVNNPVDNTVSPRRPDHAKASDSRSPRSRLHQSEYLHQVPHKPPLPTDLFESNRKQPGRAYSAVIESGNLIRNKKSDMNAFFVSKNT